MWWRGEMKFLTPIVDPSNLMGTVCRPVSLVPVRNVRRKPPLLEGNSRKSIPWWATPRRPARFTASVING
jgi:hypothetical protein